MGIINKKNQDDNVGGLHKIKIVPMSKLVAFQNIGMDGSFGTVLFETLNPAFTANIIDVEFKRQSASFDEEAAETDLGEVYKQSVVFSVDKDYAERTLLFNQLRNERFLVFIWDNNLLGKVIGFISRDGEKQGAKLISRKSTSDLYTKSNILNFTLYREADQRAFDIYDNVYFGIPPATGAEPIPPPEA